MEKSIFMGRKFLITLFVVILILTISVIALLMNIMQRKFEEANFPLKMVQISNGEINPDVWGKNFPYEYDTFMKKAYS